MGWLSFHFRWSDKSSNFFGMNRTHLWFLVKFTVFNGVYIVYIITSFKFLNDVILCTPLNTIKYNINFEIVLSPFQMEMILFIEHILFDLIF